MPLTRNFLNSRDGNVALMTGLLFSLVAMAAGGATDVSSAYNYRSALQSVADRAALHGARDDERNESEIEEFALSLLAPNYNRNTYAVTVDKSEEGIEVHIDGTSPNKFLGLFGKDDLKVKVDARASNFAGLVENIEVALVLDTTESMVDDMDDLRQAALDLVETLYEAGNDDEERVKISVVPYAGTVNIGRDAPMAWMDAGGESRWHAESIENVQVKYCQAPPPEPGDGTSSSTTTSKPSAPSCKKLCGCAGKPACGGGGDGASLELLKGLQYASSPIFEQLATLMTPTAAHAASHNYPTPAAAECPWRTPEQINNFDLFDAVPDTEWMGCVEVRPEPFDVTDTPPSGSDPDTQFVPFFWYDDSDNYDASMPWLNNYLDDDIGLDVEAPALLDNWETATRSSIYKYDGFTTSMKIDETGSNIIGPNRGCPAPLLPLTSERDEIEKKIEALTHRNGGGTAIPVGLSWGWRTLSPGAPFTEGVAYDEPDTKKIIVLLTDGANAVLKRGENSDGTPVDVDVYGDMTAYGYASSFGTGWLSRHYIDPESQPGTPYFEQIRDYLDGRTRSVCENIKNADEENPIEIFTVLIGDHDSRTEALLSDCATSEVTHYHNAAQITQLSDAFGKVAGEIIGSGRARITH